MSQLPLYIPADDEEIYNTLLNQYLRENISQNGLQSPPHTTAEITALAADAPNGVQWYDSDTHQLKIKANGVVEIIQFV